MTDIAVIILLADIQYMCYILLFVVFITYEVFVEHLVHILNLIIT